MCGVCVYCVSKQVHAQRPGSMRAEQRVQRTSTRVFSRLAGNKAFCENEIFGGFAQNLNSCSCLYSDTVGTNTRGQPVWAKCSQLVTPLCPPCGSFVVSANVFEALYILSFNKTFGVFSPPPRHSPSRQLSSHGWIATPNQCKVRLAKVLGLEGWGWVGGGFFFPYCILRNLQTREITPITNGWCLMFLR